LLSLFHMKMKINLEMNQRLWFTSDTHYNHANICSATTRWVNPLTLREFDSLDKMNDAIVNNINDNIGQDDILFHLGDWSFGGFDSIRKFRNRIVCKNIHLILGNHDEHIERNKHDVQSLFSSIQHYINLDVRRPNGKFVDKFRFVCMHYPIASWDNMNQGVIHLHGHIHLPKHLRVGNGRSLDVGMDGNNLIPLSLDEILNLMKNQPIDKLSLPKDHHVKRI
jgi:calcineurin-like phosphoesterase family protein